MQEMPSTLPNVLQPQKKVRQLLFLIRLLVASPELRLSVLAQMKMLKETFSSVTLFVSFTQTSQYISYKYIHFIWPVSNMREGTISVCSSLYPQCLAQHPTHSRCSANIFDWMMSSCTRALWSTTKCSGLFPGDWKWSGCDSTYSQWPRRNYASLTTEVKVSMWMGLFPVDANGRKHAGGSDGCYSLQNTSQRTLLFPQPILRCSHPFST